MSRLLRTIFILASLAGLLSACGSKDFRAPRNLDDACSIVREYPKYLAAMQETERDWQVPVPVQMAIIYQESKFIGNNRTPLKYVLGVIPMGRQSSAYGYAQALDGTWEEYQKERGGRIAKRDNIRHATDFMGWYMTRTEQRFGIPKSNAREHYLAYHEGLGGYARGSYNSKGWLVNVANKVEYRSQMYRQQVKSCGKI